MGKAPLSDWQFRFVSAVHRWVRRATRGLLGGRVAGMATLELHTTGRRSGRPRTCMLTTPIHDDLRVVLVASKGGGDGHPQWYLNLVAHPDVEIVLDGRRRAMRARTASPQEKAELWPGIVAAYAGYAAYQRRTDRDIPVVICDPVRTEAEAVPSLTRGVSAVVSQPSTPPEGRVYFRDVKPYAVPDSLEQLRGPIAGVVELGHSVLWAPGGGRVDLDLPGGLGLAYRAVLAEGTVEDQVSILNRDRLVAAWADLMLPRRLRLMWEARFPELRGADAA